jgi:CubicO group peptidase (beta-lactamase class C family)
MLSPSQLPRTAPEQAGIATSAILQFAEALERNINEIHSFMLLRHGQVVAEAWWSPYAPQYPHLLFSLSKSFTATAIGLAIAEGHFSLDDPVLGFFPEDAPAQPSDLLKVMRVRHLLCMATGHAGDTWPDMVNRQDGNWQRAFLAAPVVHAPGTHFVYNTGATYMLSAIVQKATGLKLIDYLRPRLFDVLGIETATWEESPHGVSAGGIGLSLTTEAVARFGQLYLQQGLWQGKQVLPAAWVAEATSSQVAKSAGMQIDWNQGYGYQFWRCRHGAYRGDGVFGQYCIVMPEQDAVLVITAGVDIFDMQKPLDLVWEILLPAMQANPLTPDPVASETLAQRLSHLSIAPVAGKPVAAMAAKVSGQTYAVDANALKIESIRFDFTDSGCMVRLTTAAGAEQIACGYGAWLQGQTALFSQPLLFDRTPTAGSGAWVAENVFKMVIRLYQTPFYYTFTCHFDSAELMIEIQVNVSLESLEPLLLTARA